MLSESARPLIEVEQRTYNGAPHFYENGSSFFIDELQYVGWPSREIDHAWALLTWGNTVPMNILLGVLLYVESNSFHGQIYLTHRRSQELLGGTLH